MLNITRPRYDQTFPQDCPLRGLAARIASVSDEEAHSKDLAAITPMPRNLLSNGLTGERWYTGLGMPLPPSEVWRAKPASGFLASHGYSLLFDPFVDASLSVVAGKNSEELYDNVNTIIVLSDYDSFANFWKRRIEAADWAENETRAFFSSKTLWLSGDNLRKAIIGTPLSLGKIPDFEETLRRAFSEQGILLWNYFPFLRGVGAKSAGGWEDMLPKQCRKNVINFLDGLLCELVECCRPKQVVVACSSHLWGEKTEHSQLESCCAQKGVTLQPAIRHPYQWAISPLDPADSRKGSFLAENIEQFGKIMACI